MQLEIYRDQALEKLLIVEAGKDVHTLSIDDQTFLKGLKPSRTIDPDFGGLPTGIDTDTVLEQIRLRGYFKATFAPSINAIDG